ncbi:hypothetical protein HNP46_006740 [Pseudomonas nitritireducens]|uniref:Uncharacterized protein n=1 Tax=Pseudomonas nitroreducens TaxID=46680 RepID=A0A7W7KS63_PSENT|nr:hypothetical protein [Pseudomonas nitritireducens]MBB4867821.1 hypothetical protein [Pseudomonas nitritireducens]
MTSTTPSNVRVDHLGGRVPSLQLLEDIKRTAKLLKKASELTHAQALNQCALLAGFSNYQHAERTCSATPGQLAGQVQIITLEQKLDIIKMYNDTMMMVATAAKLGIPYQFRGRQFTEEELRQGVPQLSNAATGLQIVEAVEKYIGPISSMFRVTREELIQMIDRAVDVPLVAPAPR